MAVILATGATMLGGCTLAPAKVHVASDMTVLTDATAAADDPTVFDPRSGSVKLAAAGNETVSFQLVVDPAGPLDRLAVSWGDLTAAGGRTIPAANVRAYRALPVPVGQPPPWYPVLIGPPPAGRQYDALVSVEARGAAQPYTLPAGQRLVLWFDVSIPRDARPGAYRTDIALRDGLRELWSCKLELKVGDFVLGDHRPIAVVGGFDHHQLFAAMIRRQAMPYVPAWLNRRQPLVRSGLIAMRQMMRLAREHHVDLFETQLHPLLKRDERGAVRLEWDDYDAIVSPYLDGSAFDNGLPCPAWPLPVTSDWPAAENYGGPGSPEYRSTVGAVLAGCREHFERCAWTTGRIFAWTDRTTGPSDVEQSALLRQLLRQQMPDAPIVRPLVAPAEGVEPAPSAPRAAEMLIGPAAQQALANWASAAAHPLDGRWLTPGSGLHSPSLTMLSSPAEVQALPWLAMKHGCRGLLLGEVISWGPQGPIADSRAAQLFYPGSMAGTDEVLASVRLKQLRRGLEDLSYLSILDQRGGEQTAREIIEALVPSSLSPADRLAPDAAHPLWTTDGLAWQLARRLLTEEVAVAVNPGRRSDPSVLLERLTWERYWDQARTVAVRWAHCRVHAAADSVGFTASATLELVNELGAGVNVQVAWQKLPVRWRGLHDSETLSPLQAGQGRTVTLTAAGDELPASDNGKVAMPISVTVETQQPKGVLVEMPIIQAAAITDAPTIDGVLDDWGAYAGNTGADFVLLPRREGPSRPADRQTQVFAAHDGENLYLAFRCLGASAGPPPSSASNIVHYEEMVACGEDLIEVLLDPGNSSEAAAELYHIVVKANGAVLAERGIAAGPQTHSARPWPAGVRAAVSKTAGLWTVELAVPLAGFGPAGRQRAWGVNFMRFSTAGGEASSWSPAARGFYNPRTLGTMIMQSGGP